ncbi:DivIVA domain-containing protein [Rothia sp. L_38]|uniref:DivIVA domain-containing protein n=1 Tax=Rothia sp. L_38 TaxID=3422315 RepID=UPI003D6A65B2
MALTPEEVINKRFQPTKFKEGYNPEEVDDFLDEIVIELRRLNAENASLKRQLEEAEAKISLAPAQQQGGALAEAEIVVDSQPAAATPAPAVAPAAAEPTLSPSSATGLLAMAQKVHDDYVFEGKRERERLITEGRDEAAKLVSEAEQKSTQVLGDLEKTKSDLEVSVAKLRSFENQYRTSLRDYLNKQLTTLEETPALEPKAEGAPAAAAAQSQGFGAFGQRNGVFSNNS